MTPDTPPPNPWQPISTVPIGRKVLGVCKRVTAPDPPKELDAIADVILAYRPKPKSKPAKKRKRRATKIAKDRST
jgi:hypothetical protein